MFKFIVRNTNNYELQKTTTMHNNTVHTHMIELITEQKNEMMTITSQYEFAWNLLIYSINLIHILDFV